MMEHTEIPPIENPLFDEWMKEHGYYIDVRDRAQCLAMHGKVSIGRFHSFEQACEAVIAYFSERK